MSLKTSFTNTTFNKPSVICYLLYGKLCIVIIPRYIIIVQKQEYLISVFNDSFEYLFSIFSVKRTVFEFLNQIRARNP